MLPQIRIDLDSSRGHIHLQVQGDCQIYKGVDFGNQPSTTDSWAWVGEKVERLLRGERLSDLG